ncbi:MAG: radical SAM protein [Mariprofundus sp.]|nr:radical SAM protein [Mariprofundus sp.]
MNRYNHDRDAAGLTYVYPVVSRRAGGVSVGINLNPNSACDWHCVYCQVPGLIRGRAPQIDLELLVAELKMLLDDILYGDFMQQRVDANCRQLCDIAISGNGEPTSCREFDAVVQAVVEMMVLYQLKIPLRLISNGSYAAKTVVQQGLKRMALSNGEVWVKVDSATAVGIQRINGVSLSPEKLFEQVKLMAQFCPSWIQTCMFNWDHEAPAEEEMDAYLGFLKRLKQDGVALRGILLYGIARPSMQPEGVHLSPLAKLSMEQLAERIGAMGYSVKLSI